MSKTRSRLVFTVDGTTYSEAVPEKIRDAVIWAAVSEGCTLDAYAAKALALPTLGKHTARTPKMKPSKAGARRASEPQTKSKAGDRNGIRKRTPCKSSQSKA